MSIEKSKKIRDTQRSLANNLFAEIEDKLSDTDTSLDCLELLLDKLIDKFEQLKQLDQTILGLTTSKNIEDEIVSTENFNGNFVNYKCKINSKIKKYNVSVNAPHINSTLEHAPAGHVVNPKSKLALPTLQLKTYYGDPDKFLEFWNSFENIIHSNDDLSDVEKLTYLKSYLSGSAASAINGLSLTGKNYSVAVTLLKNRFGRHDMLVHTHLNNLLNMSPLKNSNDLNLLRKFYDKCIIQIRNLEALNVTSNTYSNLLCPIILKMIPPDLALVFTRKVENFENCSIDDVMNFLKTEIENREKIASIHNSYANNKSNSYESKTENKFKSKTNNSPFRSSAHTLMMSGSASNGANEKCLFCSSQHKSESCNSVDINQKKEIIKKNRLCFLCLKPNHRIAQCRKKENCRVCNSKHSEAICYKKENNYNNENKNNCSNIESLQNNTEKIVSAVSYNETNKILLQTCSVRVKNKGFNCNARLLLDSGSMRTFVNRDLVNKLNLDIIRKEKLSVYTFGAEVPIAKMYDVVQLTLENRSFTDSRIVIEALVSDRISGSKIPPPEFREIKKHQFLTNLFLADNPNCNYPIALLIGADYYYNVVTGYIKHLNTNLVAVETIFGWCLQGKNKTDTTPLVMNVVVEEDLLSQQVKKFWELEGSGLIDENYNPSENEIMKSFQSKIKYENNRYKVNLPWKNNKQLLDDNREIAERRFFKLKERFRKNPELFFRYQEVLKDYLDQNIIEPVPDGSEDGVNLIFYLPHREVIREVGSTRLRIVFDGSSHAPNFPSLNDCLDSGINLYPEVFNILLRFRLYSVAFITDIKQAFLQILLDECDRDVTRFLFTANPNDETLPPLQFRFTRILFGINSSPFLLAATIKYHLKKYSVSYPNTVEFLDQNIYVDDCIGSFRTVEEAHTISKQAIQIFDEASMQLHKWRTNSNELIRLWEKENICSENIENFCVNNSVKVLGTAWDNFKDMLYFDVQSLVNFLEKKINTKRFVLQALSRIYDPIGFLGPFVVRIKCLMQKIWTLGIEWDEHLPNEICTAWDSWCEEVPFLTELCIPRYYFLGVTDFDMADLELHCFSDASLNAYGTVAYFRVTTLDKDIHTVFVASKNRVSPLKTLTLPKLELMGAILSAKLCNNILKALNLNIPCYFWTDSKIVYYWIKGVPDRFKPFVKNRVAQIQKLTNPKDWHHCPGSENPADLVSRGVKISKLLNDPMWLQGPKWLLQSPKFWPSHDSDTEVLKPDSLQLEERTTVMHVVFKEKEKLIDISKFSSLIRLLRVTAWVRRFVAKLRKLPCESGPLSAIEIQEAENTWIKFEQNEAYCSEIDQLLKNKPILPSSKILSLVPFFDEKTILRIKGRLEESSCSPEEIHPILLPNKSKFTELLIRHIHEKFCHAGISLTLVEIRNKFWIPKARQIVKRIIKSCLICRKYSLKPANQITGQLPKDRVTKTAPFTVVGIDFTGPLFIKTDQKELRKSYIALFTCSVTRAVHFELVSDMSIRHFILAFRRFLARRGNCCIVYSDNAKTFKSTSEIFKCIAKIVIDPEVKNFLTTQNITWKFIPPLSPWWGGFYERLMKSLKDPLRKILGKALLSFEEMTTIVTEIESVVNRRPLTYVSNDAGEIQPLSPIHFLIPSTNDVDYPLHFTEIFAKSSTKESLTRRRLYQTKLLNQVWIKWKDQYLLQLRNAHHFNSPTVEKDLKEGDVVLLEGTSKSKLLWPLGIVKTVYHGRDGRVRSCDVQTKKGTLKRPIQLLYPFELDE